MNTQPRHPKCRALPVELHPDIHFSAMIPRRTVKIKFFLSVVIYVVKAAFVPFLATGGNPTNAGAARLCGVSPHPIPDTATALPKQARYQLRYTRLFSFLSGWSYSPKCRALPVEPHPDIHFSAIISRRSRKSKIFLSAPVPMGKLVFAPLSVVSRNPANADAARLSGGSSYPVPDTAAVLSSAALSIGLPLILRIRRPHAGGVSTIPVFSPACKGKMALRLTAPELPSAHPRGRSSPRPRPDPRAPCGRKPPACGKWACADPAPE